jgi:exodeoxyribonuclease I
VSESSLFWHDYETFGIDPRRDRPSQFAGIRTDLDLNIIDDPVVVYCKPPLDYLPQVEACLLTGITPQLAHNKGVIEVEFARQINQHFSQPNTCSLGYNNIRFDDEFTRNCLYRNFFDPYAREWQNGNSRWDLIDVVRATKSLRPSGINWPVDAEGVPTLKLEALTQANGITHEAAHDALSDVYATIVLAKLIKTVQPKLFQFLWQHRSKTQALGLLQFGSNKPVVHISGRYSAQKNYVAVVLPIAKHPNNSNGVIVYDLAVNPELLFDLSAEEIKKYIYTATSDLPEGMARIPLKTVHLNKSPVLAPISVLRLEDQARLQIDLALCERHISKLTAAKGLAEKITKVFSGRYESSYGDDPDLAIYSGGFFSDKDKQKIVKISEMSADELKHYNPGFADKRLAEMLFRYRARNYEDSLTGDEKKRWLHFCSDKLTSAFPFYYDEIDRLKLEFPEKSGLLGELFDFAKTKQSELQH